MRPPDRAQLAPVISAAGTSTETHTANPPPFGPQHVAVALAYAGDDTAPKVVARGRGLVAQAIIEQAHQHGVYVHESKELVTLLMQVDLDTRIPPQLYRAVAELLVWIYRLEKREPIPDAGSD